MGRIRTIKPEFPQSETIGKLSRDARLLFIQLWTIVDDAGRARGASRMLASILYPYDDDAPKLIDGWLSNLVCHGCVARYEIDGTQYIEIINWAKHQKIDHPAASKLPGQTEASRRLARDREESEELSKPLEASGSLAPDLGPRTLTLDLVPKDSSPSGIPLASPQGGVSETKPKRTRKLGVYEGAWDFEAFWLAYPRQTDKGEARRALLAVERSGTVTFDEVMAGIANIDASDLQFVKHPAAWLRAEGWSNVRVERSRPAAPGAPVPYQPKAKLPPRVMLDVATFDENTWKPYIRRYLSDQTWPADLLGPDPESKGTRIPPDVLKALGIRRRPPLVNLNNGRAPEPWPTAPTTAEVPSLDYMEITQ